MNLVVGALVAGIYLATPLARSIKFGRVKIELETTTFVEVAKQLGEAPIARAGDAGGSRAQACYRTTGQATATTYYLESSEMGGGERVTQVDVVGPGSSTAAEEPILATRCGRMPRGAAAGITDTGIRLRLTRREVERRIRLSGRDSSGVTLYERCEGERTRNGAFDISSWLRVRYRQGRVAAFSTSVVSTD